jgi:hypothetical protein
MVTKGKAWPLEEELKLKELFEAGESASSIAAKLSKTEIAVIHKIKRLGLKGGGALKRFGPSPSSSSSELKLQGELLTIEDALRYLGGAMLTLSRPEISKFELERCKVLAHTASKYADDMARHLNFRGLEMECERWRKKYEDVAKAKKISPR